MATKNISTTEKELPLNVVFAIENTKELSATTLTVEEQTFAKEKLKETPSMVTISHLNRSVTVVKMAINKN